MRHSKSQWMPNSAGLAASGHSNKFLTLRNLRRHRLVPHGNLTERRPSNGFFWLAAAALLLISLGAFLGLGTRPEPPSSSMIDVALDRRYQAAIAKYDRQLLSAVGGLFQTALFGATGFAIGRRRRKTAVALVWTCLGIAALGVVVRGVTPLELLLWLAGVGLAICYSNRVKDEAPSSPARSVQ